ncbi:MAG: ECF-type sigma factor [Candidatus Krumholzibacteria bacterium]|nr:ECF-type sigma factor [Candidatus Krumholzibacteria bacterium]MDH4337394.1 ECF-type sigma factor [Candidatus Krumholzibacteria bacterium]MDH5271031.1 ECF-type sigma factor [Candidatus Krumholzibacteria bacterium]
MAAPDDITRWLERLGQGDPRALDAVMRLLYDELRTLARARLRDERAEHTLSATALVNEAYLKLSRDQQINAASRTQFFAVAARTMRRVLVDYARARKRIKRGGGAEHLPLEDVEPFLSEVEADEILALDDALTRLAELQPRAAEVVEQRFYAGLSVEETAQLLNVSAKTVQRDWIVARAWLRKEVRRELGL